MNVTSKSASGTSVLETILKSITRYNMLGPRNRGVHHTHVAHPDVQRIAVAVSGGPDSVCLLHALHELSARLGVALAVAHLNHKLRGAESDADEQFVAGIAARLGLPFHRAESDTRLMRGNLEQNARRARRAFFAGLIREGVADRVALGHTRDDQAETVLFRILRGTGPSGLAGVLPVTSDGIIRPLIGVSRSEALEFLKSRGFAWREDSSNIEPRFARNRIRLDLLPRLKLDWNPKLTESLAHLADLAYEEERAWNERIERIAASEFRLSSGAVEFLAASIVNRPRAESRRLIRHAIATVRGDLHRVEFSHIDAVLDLAEKQSGSGRLRIPGLAVVRSFDWMQLSRGSVCPGAEPPETLIRPPGEFPWPAQELDRSPFEGGCLKAYWISSRQLPAPCDNLRAAEIGLGQVDGPVILRGWRPGDRYRPAGQKRERKIKEMFQQARIPLWRRPLWPIVCIGNRVVWASGFGPAEECAPGALADGSKGQVLRLEWEPAETASGRSS